MMRPHRHQSLREEAGASSVIVILTLLLVLLPAAAIAVDLGGMWMTKRNLIADTDAAALAGAMTAVEDACNTNEVSTDALNYLAHNQGATPAAGSFDVMLDCPGETVRVELTDQSPLTFAKVLGYSQLDVTASSTAKFRSPLSFLRPLGVCVGDPIVSDVGTGKETTVIFNNNANQLDSDDPLSACGVAAGNWGWLCFSDCTGVADDPQCDDPKGTTGYLRCGVDPGLFLGGPPATLPIPVPAVYIPHDEDCATATAGLNWCETKTGSRNSLRGSAKVDAVEDAYRQGVFPILLFDQIDKKPGKTSVHPKALLWVELKGYCITKNDYGGEMTKGEANSDCAGDQFAMQFVPLYVQWTDLEVLPEEILDRIIEVEICSVDNDQRPTTACED